MRRTCLSERASPPHASDFDFAALDRLMPHPIYGRMYWVSLLSPSVATFEPVVRPLLAKAYELAVAKQARRMVEK
jgi:hypothetical protein